MIRFRRFSLQLLTLLLTLLFASLGVTYLLVSRANLRNAIQHSEDNLELAVKVYDEATAQRVDLLARSARAMTGDYTIRQLLLREQRDLRTLSSFLRSFAQRVDAPLVVLFDQGGALLASSDENLPAAQLAPFASLIRHAAEEDLEEARGFAYLGQPLHVLVAVPLYAPAPNVVGWVGLAFPIDAAFAQHLKETTGIEVTFIFTAGSESRVLASTLPAADATAVARRVGENTNRSRHTDILDLAEERYVTLFKPEALLGDEPVTVVLQRSLRAELAAAQQLEKEILFISLAALAAATLGAFWIARDVSRPVRKLAEHTRQVTAGDYSQRLDLERADEFGELASAFNEMTAGLAERNRVRDLLDKNVSPEVAQQLLRDGAALGGEEREVTILFVDLRGFTTLSEKLPARDLVALLNRYLDRMSAEIERHGGVIDKFMGDAIMVLFGAPVAQPDAADRALTAALALEEALAKLNAEFGAEGKPPLSLGVGINTARVVAGNLGSTRRLNYSVIGDGVNIAARLQALTRRSEYRTSIIVSAATMRAARPTWAMRALGTVLVKGRAQPVEIFALQGTERPLYG